MALSPRQWDQLIPLSRYGDVSGIGPAPRLIVASEGMAEAVLQMARDAAGPQNAMLIVQSSDHAQAIFPRGRDLVW